MYKAYFIEYKGEKRIAVAFPNNLKLIERFKKLSGRQWSRTLKVWHLPDSNKYRKMFNLQLMYEENLSSDTVFKIRDFIRWLKSKRYSENTIKVYSDCIKVFFNHFYTKNYQEITNADIVNFNNDYLLKRNLSSTYQNQFVNALKLFYRIIDHKEIDIGSIHRPRMEKKLPRVLSRREVKLILEAHGNLKHKTMLSLIYACGLRRSELLNVRFNDIDRHRLLLYINQAKGKKDRCVSLSPRILKMLEIYYKAYRPKVWLFEGQKEGTQYSARSLEFVLKQALDKCKLNKPVTLHWLRHSYATHLLESGTDLRYIQELLGHKSSRTTEIYTHVSIQNIQNVKSPFDDL